MKFLFNVSVVTKLTNFMLENRVSLFGVSSGVTTGMKTAEQYVL